MATNDSIILLTEDQRQFQILIGDHPFWVYKIDLNDPSRNDEEEYFRNLYINYGDPEQADDLAINSKNLVEYRQKSHRFLFGINITQSTSSKSKWGSERISTRTKCEITINKKKIYELSTNFSEMQGVNYLFAKAQTIIEEIFEHPFFTPDPTNTMVNNGREIFYYGMPAIIEVHEYAPWEITIIPDLRNTNFQSWWDQLDLNTRSRPFYEPGYWDEYKTMGKINHGEALYDYMINWHRS